MGERRFDHRRLGAHGEDLALAWYLERGYRLLARNWTCPEGELDLILARGTTVVVCEVKTRSSDRFGSPAEAVGFDKQRRVRRLAARWLATEAPRGPRDLRFDVAAVTGRSVVVVRAAF